MFPKTLSDYLAKIVKFSCKNRSIFLQESLNFPEKSSNFPAKNVKFFYKHFQSFLQWSSVFFRAPDPEVEKWKATFQATWEEMVQK